MPADLSQLPAVRLKRYQREHPDVDVPDASVEGVWRAHIPLGPGYERVLAGRTLGELMDKLERAAGGG